MPIGLLIFSLLISTAAIAEDDPARMLPAQTGALIQINDLAVWRKTMAKDPMILQVLKSMPRQHHQQAWQHMQTLLGMSGENIVDRYMGTRLVLAGPKPGWREPVMMMMRVQTDNMQTLVDRFSLEALENAGNWPVYSTQDNTTRLGTTKHWLTISRAAHEPYMRKVLTNAGTENAYLADDPEYQQWIGRLPEPHNAMAFFRGHESGHTAALAITHDDKRFSVHYVGKPPHCDKLFNMLGVAGALEMGPLPLSVVAAATINLYDPQPSEVMALDRLIAPKTYAKDILPFIDAPVIVFLAASDDPGTLPAIGMAVKLRNDEGSGQVARDLQLIIDNAMMVASVNTASWGTPPILTQSGRHGEHRYRMADVGVVLAKHTGRNELLQVRFSYGKVGNWFVACSSDKVFNQCLDAQADASLRLSNNAGFKSLPLHDVKNPILAAFLRGQAAKAHLDTWLQFWRHANPNEIDARIATAIERSSHFFEQCDAMTVQFHRSEDQMVMGVVNVLRK